MNYRKAWKKRKKAELKRLEKLVCDAYAKASTATDWQEVIQFGTEMELARDQYFRVLSQSFKRPRRAFVIEIKPEGR